MHSLGVKDSVSFDSNWFSWWFTVVWKKIDLAEAIDNSKDPSLHLKKIDESDLPKLSVVAPKSDNSKTILDENSLFKTPVDEEATSNKEPITNLEALDFSTRSRQQAFGANPNVDTPYRTTVISEAGRSNPSNPSNPNGGLVLNPSNPPNPPNPNGGLVLNPMNPMNPSNPGGGLVLNPMNPMNPSNPGGGLALNPMNPSNPSNPSNPGGGLVLTPPITVPRPPLILRLTIWICFSRSHKTFSISSKTPKEKQNEIIRYVNVPLHN